VRTEPQSAHAPTSSELEQQAGEPAHETALLSEAALAEDWSRPVEDAAWAQLQRENSHSEPTKGELPPR
jgi:hypothetical protein